MFWRKPRIADGLLLFLCPMLVPVLVPTLLCLVAIVLGPIAIPVLIDCLLLVRVLRRRGFGRNLLVGFGVHSCLLGHLPGTGLLLLVN